MAQRKKASKAGAKAPGGAALTSRRAAFVAEYLVDLNATQAAIRAGLALSPAVPPADFYVYGLVDPERGDLFYIGKGSGARMFCHAAEARNGRVSNAAKFRRLAEIGEPAYLVFAEGLSERAAYGIEREMVAAVGRERLTNVLCPARNADEVGAAKAEDLLRRVKPLSTWAGERPRTEREAGLYWFVVEQLKRLATGEIVNQPISPWCRVVNAGW